jgi:2-keto-4-pentenoate hydratase/2-oxohepta-3-ene-1,7-dioic acid hydratase in catechol pathway
VRIARIKTGHEVAHALAEHNAYRLIEGNIFGSWKVTDRTLGQADAKLVAPVDPPQIVAIGLNYRGHAAESGMAIPEAPLVFIKTCNAIVGHGEPILLPKMAPDEVDYECELVIVIGARAKNVSTEQAAEYILGYTCGNDVSARDCQLRHDKQWARGKSFDTFAPIGPWIETDPGDPDNLDITLTLNGETMQSSNTSDLVFSCAELVSYISQCMTLEPGSIIMSGTPAGVGFARKPPVFLREEDTVTVEIQGIGQLTNPVAKER